MLLDPGASTSSPTVPHSASGGKQELAMARHHTLFRVAAFVIVRLPRFRPSWLYPRLVEALHIRSFLANAHRPNHFLPLLPSLAAAKSFPALSSYTGGG